MNALFSKIKMNVSRGIKPKFDLLPHRQISVSIPVQVYAHSNTQKIMESMYSINK